MKNLFFKYLILSFNCYVETITVFKDRRLHIICILKEGAVDVYQNLRSYQRATGKMLGDILIAMLYITLITLLFTSRQIQIATKKIDIFN